MNRLKHGLLLGLAILALVLFSAPVLRGAPDKNDTARWEYLRKVTPGSAVRVVLKNIESWEGKLGTVSEDGLTMRTSGGEKTFARDNIVRVSTKGRSHRKRNLLIGLGVGAVTGVIIGVADPELGQGTCEQGSCANAGVAAMVGAAGAVGGAAIGAIIPTGGWHEVFRASEEAAAQPGGNTTAVQPAISPAGSLVAGEFVHR